MSFRPLDPQSPEEQEVRNKTEEFVTKHVRPFADADDAASRFRREVFTEVTKLGYHAMSHDPKYGGLGRPHRCYYAFLEELGRGSLALSVSVGVTNLVQGALARFGTDAQKNQYLKSLTSGKYLGAFSLSEPHSGSDASALRLAAKKVDGGYLLTGNKTWCSNAGHADVYLVMARTGSHKTKGVTSFIVPAASKGFRVGKQEKKLGLRASTLAELVFEDCFVPNDQRIGSEGQGMEVALSQLDAGRISIGAAGIAAATEALEIAWKHVRKQGEQGGAVEGLQHQLGDYFSKLVSAKAIIGLAADKRDRGESVTLLASSLKLLASDLAVQVCHDAVTFMGYEGCQTGSGVERLLRDSKALQIVEGTNQIQRLVLSRQLDLLIS